MTAIVPPESTNATILKDYGSSATNKVIVITGVSPNTLGAYFALGLASYSPAKLILLSRNAEGLSEVEKEVLEKNSSTSVQTVQCDLSSIQSVREAVKTIQQPVDILVNSASIMAAPFEQSVDGIEMHFAIGHLGHFLLFNLLLKDGKMVNGARVLNVSSGGYLLPGFDESLAWEGYNWDKGTPYERWSAYSFTKAANIVFSRAINDKFGSSHGIKSFVPIPGANGTKIGRFLTQEDYQRLAALKMPVYNPAETGLIPYLVAALVPSLDPKAGIVTTEFGTQTETAGYASIFDMKERMESIVGPVGDQEGKTLGWKGLWEVSERLVGEKF